MTTNLATIAFGPGYGGDGGFWVLGADGRLHWVPPWDPEIVRDLQVATSLAQLAPQIRSVGLRTQVEDVAQSIAAVHAKAIQAHTRALSQ